MGPKGRDRPQERDSGHKKGMRAFFINEGSRRNDRARAPEFFRIASSRNDHKKGDEPSFLCARKSVKRGACYALSWIDPQDIVL